MGFNKLESSLSQVFFQRITLLVIFFTIVVSICLHVFGDNRILKGLSSDLQYNYISLQLSVTAFCLSSVPGTLIARDRLTRKSVGGDFHFGDDGDIENDDYSKASIYSLLYSIYSTTGIVKSEHGIPYQFTFNTWGISPKEDSPYGDEDPQRMAKNAYYGLVNFSVVHEYLEKVTSTPQIVEIGCGTGAGANLISKEIIPGSSYLALDMQQAAINTCNSLHRGCGGEMPPKCEPNLQLKCQLVPGGIGNKNSSLPNADESVDFVIISEAHIADVKVGDEEKAIFQEIKRVLKPGGLFLWGNALPTRVWLESIPFLESNGFELKSKINHTQAAIRARDLDYDRVEAYVAQVFSNFPVFKVASDCRHVSERLLMNFYRHPGTALYQKMTTGFDSYMHLAFEKSV